MKQFAKTLSLTVGLGILVVVLNFITDRPVRAQDPGPTKNVNVVNPASSPVLVRDVDNPARHPFQVKLCDANGSVTCGGVPVEFTAPSGQELVIEYVSGDCLTGSTGRAMDIKVVTIAGGVPLDHHFNDPAIGAGSALNFGQQTRIYADPGTKVIFVPALLTGDSMCVGSVSGYTVTL